jgi:hypothetical protein
MAMPKSTYAAALAALLGVGAWHLPVTAQEGPAPPPAAVTAAGENPPRLITFDEYRDYRLHYVAQRQTSLTRQLAAPGLSADEKSRLTGIKAYYDRIAAMPAADRDRMFRARFDEIDIDHDGTLDDAERADWRAKRRQYYATQAAEAPPANRTRR